MTVAKMITILEAMPQDVEVCYFDTWWDCEGWGDNADESKWNGVSSITHDIEDNTVLLY